MFHTTAGEPKLLIFIVARTGRQGRSSTAPKTPLSSISPNQSPQTTNESTPVTNRRPSLARRRRCRRGRRILLTRLLVRLQWRSSKKRRTSFRRATSARRKRERERKGHLVLFAYPAHAKLTPYRSLYEALINIPKKLRSRYVTS